MDVVENIPNQHFVLLLRKKRGNALPVANFRLKDLTRADIAPFAHAHNVLLNRASSGHATSGHVTDVTFGHVTSGSNPNCTPTNTTLQPHIYYYCDWYFLINCIRNHINLWINQLSVYIFIFNNISLLFLPIFLNLTCAYPYLYNLC